MAIAVFYPHFDHPAIEERYASWQTQMLLRDEDVSFFHYDPGSDIGRFASLLDGEDGVLIVTDPLLLSRRGMARRLQEALRRSEADLVVPSTNASRNAAQVRPPSTPYLTLREFEAVSESMGGSADRSTAWDDSDPGAFFCTPETLSSLHGAAAGALRGREVLVASEYIHRWSSLRGQVREDLLALIAGDARAILEFGCGEAPLGAALKSRQKCRVVGIELDREAAAVARKRIDDVYCADVREIVAILPEKFDWIIGGDIVEHLDEPWTFLADLRRLATPGGRLVLSLPNISNASVIADLLRGRFDYVYMGLTCVGHLRFFTRQSISELLEIAGWDELEIVPQRFGPTRGGEELLGALGRAGFEYSTDDVEASGYYVIARNPE